MNAYGDIDQTSPCPDPGELLRGELHAHPLVIRQVARVRRAPAHGRTHLHIDGKV